MENTNNSWVDRLNLRSQALRGQYFNPLLKFLTQKKITANGVTNFRLVLGVVAVLIFEWWHRYAWGYNLLFLAILLDVLDGALARYQNTASDRGKFLDIFVDYILYAFLLIFVEAIAGSYEKVVYNLFIIPILYLLAIIKKQEFLPSDWIIKPYAKITYVKSLVYLSFYCHWYFGLGSRYLINSLAFSNYAATILSVYYFIYIQLRWKKTKI